MNRLAPTLRPLLAAAAGLLLGLLLTFLAGEKPWEVLKILALGAFGSPYSTGMTLFYSTPLILTGLSVAIAYRCGLFNIGAEGQLTLGALAAAWVGSATPNLSAPIAVPLATTAAVLAGGFWGWLPGWLRVRRGSHEVITTVMLNFVAAALASWVTLYLLKNPANQNPETLPVGPGYLLAPFSFFAGAPVGWPLVGAVGLAVALWLAMKHTVAGFEAQMTGENPSAARTAGIDVGRVRMLGLSLAGAVAGLVAVPEVLGNSGRFRLGFSADYGFTGIAVALLARGHPLGILLAALLFGALHKGTGDLDLETEHVTRDLALVLQALIVLSVALEEIWGPLFRRRPATVTAEKVGP